jgi:hypothetical protein
MRLTVETDPESIKRYRHVKPARGFGVRSCTAKFPGTARACTLPRRHRGPHVAHGRLGKILAVWDSGTEVTAARGSKPAAGSTRSVRENSKAVGLVGVLRGVAARVDLSMEGIALLVLFIALVGFVIDWLLMIIR